MDININYMKSLALVLNKVTDITICENLDLKRLKDVKVVKFLETNDLSTVEYIQMIMSAFENEGFKEIDSFILFYSIYTNKNKTFAKWLLSISIYCKNCLMLDYIGIYMLINPARDSSVLDSFCDNYLFEQSTIHLIENLPKMSTIMTCIVVNHLISNLNLNVEYPVMTCLLTWLNENLSLVCIQDVLDSHRLNFDLQIIVCKIDKNYTLKMLNSNMANLIDFSLNHQNMLRLAKLFISFKNKKSINKTKLPINPNHDTFSKLVCCSNFVKESIYSIIVKILYIQQNTITIYTDKLFEYAQFYDLKFHDELVDVSNFKFYQERIIQIICFALHRKFCKYDGYIEKIFEMNPKYM
ncbi:hypothetical protein A3Q56_03644 [Intoshia linei]|uniref:Uncharacterized protein n=1 Tax=Intoshia linei TaxID=1819745 RepID=A0A177B5C4_9BILA|nr:hypothetical protein A3Q56_03644 [Intoshia linei]